MILKHNTVAFWTKGLSHDKVDNTVSHLERQGFEVDIYEETVPVMTCYSAVFIENSNLDSFCYYTKYSLSNYEFLKEAVDFKVPIFISYYASSLDKVFFYGTSSRLFDNELKLQLQASWRLDRCTINKKDEALPYAYQIQDEAYQHVMSKEASHSDKRFLLC